MTVVLALPRFLTGEGALIGHQPKRQTERMTDVRSTPRLSAGDGAHIGHQRIRAEGGV